MYFCVTQLKNTTMPIYPQQTPTSFVEATQAGLNSNQASINNPFLTEEDLNKDGVSFVVLIAPNGSKWKVVVANNGTLSTSAL